MREICEQQGLNWPWEPVPVRREGLVPPEVQRVWLAGRGYRGEGLRLGADSRVAGRAGRAFGARR